VALAPTDGVGPGPARGAGRADDSLHGVRCPWCLADDDRVVDSRLAEEGAAIRRRRECLSCHRRYTTFERVDEIPLLVVKRSGEREPFDQAKLIRGIRAASKNRPVAQAQLEEVAQAVEEALREAGNAPTSEEVGRAVLERLQSVDEVAYLRFASVYKGFEGADDFRREVGLLTKTTAPKRTEG
jgi:transcriptional repressor NrdR